METDINVQATENDAEQSRNETERLVVAVLNAGAALGGAFTNVSVENILAAHKHTGVALVGAIGTNSQWGGGSKDSEGGSNEESWFEEHLSEANVDEAVG